VDVSVVVGVPEPTEDASGPASSGWLII